VSISIIIPIYNQLEDLKKCIESIVCRTYSDYKIVLVNDNSGHETTEYCNKLVTDGIAAKHKYIYGRKPKGFTSAVNEGIKLLKADYYCLLNSDTIVYTNDWLNRIEEVFYSGEDVGLVGPVSNSATSQTIPFRIGTSPAMMSLLVSLYTQQRYPETKLVNGFCYFISSKVVKSCGLLDEREFPHYGSEDDYSLKVRKAGFKCKIADNVFVWHKGSASYKDFKHTAIPRNVKHLFVRHGREYVLGSIKGNALGIQYLKDEIEQEGIFYGSS